MQQIEDRIGSRDARMREIAKYNLRPLKRRHSVRSAPVLQIERLLSSKDLLKEGGNSCVQFFEPTRIGGSIEAGREANRFDYAIKGEGSRTGGGSSGGV